MVPAEEKSLEGSFLLLLPTLEFIGFICNCHEWLMLSTMSDRWHSELADEKKNRIFIVINWMYVQRKDNKQLHELLFLTK